MATVSVSTTSTASDRLIQNTDFVALKKDDCVRIIRVDNTTSGSFWFLKERIEIGNLVGCPYGSIFRIVGHKLQRIENVEEFFSTLQNQEDFRGQDAVEGKDNRNIVDDGRAQKLSKDDIQLMRDQGVSGKEIIEQIVENSSTFKEKTEFSKAKYLKKKRQKYMSYVIAMLPTVRLLTEVYMSQDSSKILNLRPEYLGQLLSHLNVQSGGRYLVSETCRGLVVAGVADRLAGQGLLVHVSPDTSPFPNTYQQLNMCETDQSVVHSIFMCHLDVVISERSLQGSGDPSPQINKKEPRNIEARKRYEMIYDLLTERPMDGLVLATRFHPVHLTEYLLKFVGLSKPVVIYNPYREPLLECCQYLRDRGDMVDVRLSETWCRSYQVLPDRTRPENNMYGPVGYLLTAIKAQELPR